MQIFESTRANSIVNGTGAQPRIWGKKIPDSLKIGYFVILLSVIRLQ
jgi:hypothetical protein